MLMIVGERVNVRISEKGLKIDFRFIDGICICDYVTIKEARAGIKEF